MANPSWKMAYSPWAAMCGLCSQSYDDPRLLPCLHVFCLKCLRDRSDSSSENAPFVCPTCYAHFSGAVDCLPKHVYLSNEAKATRRVDEIESSGMCESCPSGDKAQAYCYDCREDGCLLCAQCLSAHSVFHVFKKHAIVQSVAASRLRGAARELSEQINKACVTHSDEIVKYFCQSCESLVCRECIIRDHSSHKFQDIQNVLDEQKSEIQSFSQDLEQALHAFVQVEDALKGLLRDIDVSNREVRARIEEIFAEIITAAEKRKHELLSEADAMATAKKTQLQIQQEGMEKVILAMKLAMGVVQASTQSYSPVEFLSIKASLKQSLMQLSKQCSEKSLIPVTNASISLRVDASSAINVLSNTGIVVEGTCVGPDLCSLVNINANFPIGIASGTKRTLFLQMRNTRGEDLTDAKAHVKAWLVNQSEAKACDADVSYADDGKYNISFQSAAKMCKLHVTVDGGEITGSPFKVNIRDYSQIKHPLMSFSTPFAPRCLSVNDHTGDIIVTQENGPVLVYSSDFVLKSTIDCSSLGITRSGIAVDVEREVMYVSCQTNCKVIKATLDGRLISSVGSTGSGELQFTSPIGVHLDVDGNIYVCEANHVQVLGSDLSFIKMLNVENPYGLDIDSTGNLHVATGSGMRILSSNGCKHKYGSPGQYRDVAISPDDFKFTTTLQQGGALAVYKPDNSLLTIVKGLGKPFGVSLDQSGFIYVTEACNKKVHKY